ncbi:hypothetical protein DFH11DRAFT_1879724 [Phellopilus nigrolimitatus]|nr:hypothetical protein DFH11DRAFT_1879724 [Phellopilus nigrolimitatus]
MRDARWLRCLVQALGSDVVLLNPNQSSSTSNFQNAEKRTFTERVLSLLMVETSQHSGTTAKLIHLADEVVREHGHLSISQASYNPASLDEQTLHNFIDAYLKPTSAASRPRSSPKDPPMPYVPDATRTGRDRKRPKRRKMDNMYLS